MEVFMIKLGITQTLEVCKKTDFGVYLKDKNSSNEDIVLLPKNQLNIPVNTGDSLEVFIYKDSEDRMIATRQIPALELGQVALLKVIEVSDIGAFLDWHLTKDLFLPFKEQTKEIKAGDEILVALYIDKSQRLCGTMKIYDYLSTNSPYQKDDKITGTVYELSPDFGVFVAVDNQYSALIPPNEIFQSFEPGDQIQGRVTSLREDGKLNLSLREKVFVQMDVDAETIYNQLIKENGFLPFHDKSTPQEIKQKFGLSKNAFKRALGRLFKNGKIVIENNGIHLKS